MAMTTGIGMMNDDGGGGGGDCDGATVNHLLLSSRVVMDPF